MTTVAHAARNMLERPESWTDKVLHGVAADFFPRFITVEQLLALIERTEEPKHSAGGFEWVSRQIVEAVDPVRLEFPILSLHPGLRPRGVAPDRRHAVRQRRMAMPLRWKTSGLFGSRRDQPPTGC